MKARKGSELEQVLAVVGRVFRSLQHNHRNGCHGDMGDVFVRVVRNRSRSVRGDQLVRGRKRGIEMKIDRCPKCGKEPMTYLSTPFIRLNPTTILGDTKYVCHCSPCGLIVKGKTRDEAIAKWNEITKRGAK